MHVQLIRQERVEENKIKRKSTEKENKMTTVEYMKYRNRHKATTRQPLQLKGANDDGDGSVRL